jgi:hypothetical protein
MRALNNQKTAVSVCDKVDMSMSEIIRRSPVAGIKDAEFTLRKCIFRSQEVRYGFINSDLACVWGLIPPSFFSEVAYIWLLTTEIAAEHKFLFVRHSQRHIEDALKVYPALVGHVLVENIPARQWLKWLGADFEVPVGKGMAFTIRRKELR